MSDIRLRSGDAALTLSPGNGGRMAGLRVNGFDLLASGQPGLFGWGSFPMVPFAGRVRRGRLRWGGRPHGLPITMPPHAIHGVTLDRPWQLDDVAPTAATMSCGLDARWPWAGRAVAQVDLADDRLETRLEVQALVEPMPAWIGWHPWFARRLSRGEPARLEVQAEGVLVRDADGIPDGRLEPAPQPPWDDCFVDVHWPAAVVWDGALRLEVRSDAGFAVLFDERPDAVCLEPQTGPPDAVALDRHAVVEPGQPLTMTMTWTWSPA